MVDSDNRAAFGVSEVPKGSENTRCPFFGDSVHIDFCCPNGVLFDRLLKPCSLAEHQEHGRENPDQDNEYGT